MIFPVLGLVLFGLINFWIRKRRYVA